MRIKNLEIQENSSKYLNTIIEKAIFYNYEIFVDYFEVTDERSIQTQIENVTSLNPDKELTPQEVSFNFLSIMISQSCAEINTSITELNKRVSKEPHFWIVAEKGLDE